MARTSRVEPACPQAAALGRRGTMVNGQPCMLNWAACFRHRGTYVKLLPIYISACRKYCCPASHAFQFAHIGIDESAIRKHQRIAAQNVTINCWLGSSEWRGFAGRHGKIFRNDVRKFEVHCRKWFRRVEGPLFDIDWNREKLICDV